MIVVVVAGGLVVVAVVVAVVVVAGGFVAVAVVGEVVVGEVVAVVVVGEVGGLVVVVWAGARPVPWVTGTGGASVGPPPPRVGSPVGGGAEAAPVWAPPVVIARRWRALAEVDRSALVLTGSPEDRDARRPAAGLPLEAEALLELAPAAIPATVVVGAASAAAGTWAAGRAGSVVRTLTEPSMLPSSAPTPAAAAMATSTPAAPRVPRAGFMAGPTHTRPVPP